MAFGFATITITAKRCVIERPKIDEPSADIYAGPERSRRPVQAAPGPSSAMPAWPQLSLPHEIPTGTLLINAFASAAREVMEPLILSFLQRYPQMHVDRVTMVSFLVALLMSVESASLTSST